MQIVVFGGPNGAGKTTAAMSKLADYLDITQYVNADEIARALSPLDPGSVSIAAGRIMLQRLDDLVRARQSFAFETTCSGVAYVRFLGDCKAQGYQVTLLYFWVPSPDISVARVAQRVSEGGHGIPTEVLIRRYRTGVRNMRHLYLPLADEASIYDNSVRPGLLVAEAVAGALTIHDAVRWAAIEETAR